jgi:hypothetical protein
VAARLTVADLVDLGDLDELLRRVDDLCDGRDWEGLLDLRDRCRVAFERGRQLWPAASHAEYRLALQAPGEWAASVVVPGAGRFALGPLSEVVASSHTWDDLAAHLPATPDSALVAQERVLRGEDLRHDDRVDAAVVELPLVLQEWEPAYPLATYRPYAAEFGDVALPAAWERVGVGPVVEPAGDEPASDEPAGDEATRSLLELVAPWTTQSNGQASAVAVRGDALDALAGLGVRGSLRLSPLDVGDALALMAWAGASGGAHGRRRGMAQGRFGAWWALAAVAGTIDEWPDLEGAVDADLRWYRWDRDDPATGWALRLAVEDADRGRAWAVEATDHR